MPRHIWLQLVSGRQVKQREQENSMSKVEFSQTYQPRRRTTFGDLDLRLRCMRP